MNVAFTGGIVLTAGRLSVGPAPAGISSFTTWNPSDKHALVTLTLGDLVADNDSAGPSDRIAVRSIASRTNGKYYWEVEANATPPWCWNSQV